jgi:two-component system, chemotaxis family, CheB/CheR fusion protein
MTVPPAMTEDQSLDALLDYIKRSRGFDFSGYKRTSLGRRVQKRMEAIEVASYADYLDYLEVHPDEFAELFDTILINVTSFFRDAPSWEYLEKEILPPLLEQRDDGDDIRVWCAGCASGEEAYTIAMVLAEALGEKAFLDRVKIYATDVDDDALTTARQAIFDSRAAKDIPEELLAKYFQRADTRFAFRKDLRRAVIFGRNDLVQDAPISRVDLLICRNTLMYFNAETQARILAHFNFALNESGYLYLGKSEMLITHSNLFTPVSLKRRVFTKVPRHTLRDRLAFAALPAPLDEPTGPNEPVTRLRDGALETSPVAQIVVERAGEIVAINHAARALFGLSTRDVGRPLQDLEISYRPAELRSGIEQAYGERRAVSLGSVAWAKPGEDSRMLDVQVTPLFSSDGQMLGASITFADETNHRRMQEDLERARRELELAYEELQSTVEELETTNEELQSTNEELETTNEELQSTNEELETMNEELQSTNEELETINDELRERTTELNRVNGFLEGILTSLGIGVVVVDRERRVQVWNRHVENLWGLREDEVFGQSLMGLDIGLPVDQLKAQLRAALDGEDGDGAVTLDAVNRRGRQIKCAVTVLPLALPHADVNGAILLMEASSDGASADGDGDGSGG